MFKPGSFLIRVLRRIAFEINLLCYRFGFRYVPVLPYWLDVEPINICNLACNHCQVTHWSKPKAVLSFESFKSLLSQFRFLRTIKLQGMGEPFLNKDIWQMLRLGERRGIEMFTITNATVLTEKIIGELKTLSKTGIMFSIDAGKKDSFESIREGSHFETILANIRRIVAEVGSTLTLEFNTLLLKQNISEALAIVQLAKELKIERIVVRVSVWDWAKPNTMAHTHDMQIDIRSQDASKEIERMKALAKECGIELLIHEHNSLSKKNKCTQPFTAAYITAVGDVTPCCVLADSDIITFGNVHEQPFRKIWNSKAYRDFRKSISTHNLREYCKGYYIHSTE